MFNRRKKPVRNFLKNIRKGSDAEKMRLIWFLVIFFMVGVFLLWVDSAQKNFARMSEHRLDTSALPNFPKLDDIDFNIEDTLKNSGEKINEYLAEDKAHWQTVGDKYIKEKVILDADGFSDLKFVDSKKDGDAVLLEYAQYYKDIPVLGYGLTLSANPDDGSVIEKEIRLAGGINLAVDPAVSLKAAGEIAEKAAGNDGYAFQTGSLVIVRYEGEFYPAWQIILVSNEDGSTKNVLVGAKRGNVISADAALPENVEENQTSDIVE